MDQGVERIVDQVVNPKIASVFIPQVEDMVYKCFGIEKPDKDQKNLDENETKPFLSGDLGVVCADSEKLNTRISPESKMPETKSIDVKHENRISEDSCDSSKEDDFESPAFEPITDVKMERNINDFNSQGAIEKLTYVATDSQVSSDSNTSANNSCNGFKGKSFENSFKNITLEDTANMTTAVKSEVSEYKFTDCDNSTDARQAFEPMEIDKEPKVAKDSETENSLDETCKKSKTKISSDNERNEIGKSIRSSIESKSSEDNKLMKNFTDASMDSSESKESTAFMSTSKTEVLTFENKIIPLNEGNLNTDDDAKNVECDSSKSKSSSEEKITEKDKSTNEERKSSVHKDKKDESKHRSSHSKHSSSRRDSDRRHSSSSSHHKSSSHSHDRDKSGSSKDRHSSSHKSSKSSHHSSSKHSSSDSKHRSDDTSKSRRSSHHHDSSKSSTHKSKHSSSSKYSSHDDKKHLDSSSRRSSHSSSEKKSDDKKKKSTDHCSSSVKDSKNRRSTDRDSNDGNSSFSKGNNPPSSSKSSQKEKKSSSGEKCSNGNYSSGQSDSVNNDIINISAGGYIKSEFNMFQPVVKKPTQLELNIKKAAENAAKQLQITEQQNKVEPSLEQPTVSPLNQDPVSPTQNLLIPIEKPVVEELPKIKKPKFASNIFEARKMIKIRKNIDKQEKKKQQDALRNLEKQQSKADVVSDVSNVKLEIAPVGKKTEIQHINTVKQKHSPKKDFLCKFFDNATKKRIHMDLEKLKLALKNVSKRVHENNNVKKYYLYGCNQSTEEIFKRIMPDNKTVNIVNIPNKISALVSNKENSNNKVALNKKQFRNHMIRRANHMKNKVNTYSPASPENIQDYGDNTESAYTRRSDLALENTSKKDIMEIILGGEINFEAAIVDLQRVEAVLPKDSARSSNEVSLDSLPQSNMSIKRKVSYSDDNIISPINMKKLRVNLEQMAHNEVILCGN